MLRGLALRFRSLFHRARVEAELEEELAYHLEAETARLQSLGVSSEEARRAARREFGNVAVLKEESRDARSFRLLEEAGADLRHAVALLRRSPGFTTAALLILAVAIGVNTAIFGVSDEMFLRAIPEVREPARLVKLQRTRDGQRLEGFGHPSYLKYRDSLRTLTGLAAYRQARLLWRHGEVTEPIPAWLVSGNYLTLLGITPRLGRDFLPEEDGIPGLAPVALLGHRFWRERLNADSAVFDHPIDLNGTAFTVVGVLPPGFEGIEEESRADVWLPIMMEDVARPGFPTLHSDFFSSLDVFGRLAPGASLAQAEAELGLRARAIEQRDGVTGTPRRVVLSSDTRFPEGWRAGMAGTVARLWTLAGLVLLVACANLAGLLLARSAARRHELLLRQALGADRARVVRQVVTESVALALPAAVGGLFVSRWITAVMRASGSTLLLLQLTVRNLLFAVLVALLATAALALPSALAFTRSDLLSDLRGGAGVGRRLGWLRRGLLATQIAISLALLAGAGLLFRSLEGALALDLGFDPARVLTYSPELDLAGYDVPRARAFFDGLAARLDRAPGVEATSLALDSPVEPGLLASERDIVFDDGTGPSSGPRPRVAFNAVAPGYFRALGLSIRRGRDFLASDGPAAPRVAVVDERMARSLWPAGGAVGRRIRFAQIGGVTAPLEIVGVVSDARREVAEEPIGEVFVPFAQDARGTGEVVIRVDGPEREVDRALQAAVHALDPTLPPARAERLTTRVSGSLEDERLFTRLTTLFGTTAVLLAAVGLYGTLALAVARREREMGIRKALGARRGNLLWLILREGASVTALGVAIGILGGFLLGRLLSALLVGVSPGDPLTLLLATLGVIAAAGVACWIPALRAARVEPLQALRAE